MSALVVDRRGLWERVKSLLMPAHIQRRADEADARMSHLADDAAQAHQKTNETIRDAYRAIGQRLDGR